MTSDSEKEEILRLAIDVLQSVKAPAREMNEVNATLGRLLEQIEEIAAAGPSRRAAAKRTGTERTDTQDSDEHPE